MEDPGALLHQGWGIQGLCCTRGGGSRGPAAPGVGDPGALLHPGTWIHTVGGGLSGRDQGSAIPSQGGGFKGHTAVKPSARERESTGDTVTGVGTTTSVPAHKRWIEEPKHENCFHVCACLVRSFLLRQKSTDSGLFCRNRTPHQPSLFGDSGRSPALSLDFQSNSSAPLCTAPCACVCLSVLRRTWDVRVCAVSPRSSVQAVRVYTEFSPLTLTQRCIPQSALPF